MDNDPYVTHLGDGCYVRYTGYSLIFMANSHINPTDTVSLDMPRGLKDLVNFVEASDRFAIQMAIIKQVFPNAPS